MAVTYYEDIELESVLGELGYTFRDADGGFLPSVLSVVAIKEGYQWTDDNGDKGWYITK